MSPKKQLKIVVTREWQPSELLAETRAGMTEAAYRVGNNDRKRLSWLLEFVDLTAETLARLSESERTQWRYDLAYFADVLKPMELPRLEDVALGAAEIKKGIGQLTRPFGRWTFKLPENCLVERTIEPRRIKRRGRSMLEGLQSYYTSDDIQAAFLLYAADAIEAEGTRIRVCARKDCGRRFARHRRARYCSSQCSQKERDSR
jgi:hypothetical protein